MRQFQFEYEDKISFAREIVKLDKWCKTHICTNVVFHIFSETPNKDILINICSVIESKMPYALYMGCSSNGNIVDGALSENSISITCTIFEYPSTQIKLLQYDFSANSQLDAAKNLQAEVESMGNVKAIEMLMTIRGMSLSTFCDALDCIDKDIQIFGGGAFNLDLNSDVACVFTNVKGFRTSSIAFLLISGDDFYIKTSYVTGWKPLGRDLHVTKAESSILYELDGKPAYDTYYKYLNIKNDENFFYNTLEFPFLYRHNGIDILRAPIASRPDGSLVMTSDIEENVTARIAYGDPWTILESVEQESANIRCFEPEIIHIYSCAARRTFWGNHEAENETMPFHKIAPVTGFYTSGEFLRTNGKLNQHNVTLVIAAMREGELEDFKIDITDNNHTVISGKISMVSRLATFIAAAAAELEEANRKLEIAAISDGLTKLYNRTEIQRRIENMLYTEKKPFSLIMLDIDNFKQVNDSYGHKEGDNIIIALSELLREVADKETPKAEVGRWGGEEFMMMLPEKDTEQSKFTAEKIRTAFAAMDFEKAGHKTISLGITAAVNGEMIDELCSRVDSALYSAKEAGKNTTFII